MKLTLIARHPSIDISSRLINLNDNVVGSLNVNFLGELESEVKANPRNAKKLRKLLSATTTMCLSMLMVVQPTMASTLSPVPNIDPDLVNTLLILMLTCAGLGVLAAVVGLMLAGVWKMFYGGTQADIWRQNIYRGLGQVILAPITVSLIVGLAILLFSKIPAFYPIMKAISVLTQN